MIIKVCKSKFIDFIYVFLPADGEEIELICLYMLNNTISLWK